VDTDTKEPVTEVLPTRELRPAPEGKLTKGQKASIQAHKNMSVIEDDLFARAHQVVSDVLAFRDLDLDDMEGTLAKWTEELGAEEARKKWQLAKAAWKKKSEMPGGIAASIETFVGISKSRSKQPMHVGEMKAVFITMNAPVEYPEIVEESDE
jgi:hypothetical protein